MHKLVSKLIVYRNLPADNILMPLAEVCADVESGNSVRIRSINEIKEYLKRKEVEETLLDNTIERLQRNNLLNDDIFTKAFINDKLNFTTMGPYRIEQELKKHKIDSNIISKYIGSIEDELIDNKINKQIEKLLKTNKKKCNIRNKIYLNLLNLGYSNEMILRNINNYDFSNQ